MAFPLASLNTATKLEFLGTVVVLKVIFGSFTVIFMVFEDVHAPTDPILFLFVTYCGTWACFKKVYRNESYIVYTNSIGDYCLLFF